MKIELLNGFTRVNPQDTANEFSLEGRKRRGRQAMQKIKGRKKMRLRQAQNPTRQAGAGSTTAARRRPSSFGSIRQAKRRDRRATKRNLQSSART